MGVLEVADVVLTKPDHFWANTVPLTFRWTPRSNAKESYRWSLSKGCGMSLDREGAYRTETLGHTARYELEAVPPGFAYDLPYCWFISIDDGANDDQHDNDKSQPRAFHWTHLSTGACGLSVGASAPAGSTCGHTWACVAIASLSCAVRLRVGQNGENGRWPRSPGNSTIGESSMSRSRMQAISGPESLAQGGV